MIRTAVDGARGCVEMPNHPRETDRRDQSKNNGQQKVEDQQRASHCDDQTHPPPGNGHQHATEQPVDRRAQNQQ